MRWNALIASTYHFVFPLQMISIFLSDNRKTKTVNSWILLLISVYWNDSKSFHGLGLTYKWFRILVLLIFEKLVLNLFPLGNFRAFECCLIFLNWRKFWANWIWVSCTFILHYLHGLDLDPHHCWHGKKNGLNYWSYSYSIRKYSKTHISGRSKISYYLEGKSIGCSSL